MDLQTALAHLDPQQPDHWTADGLPRMDVLHSLTDDSTIKRQDVTNMAPDLTQATAPELDEQPELTGSGDPAAELEIEDDAELEDDDAGELEEELAPKEVAEFTDQATDPVLDMDSRQVIADYGLTKRCMAAIDAKHTDALQRRSALDEELKQLNAKTEILKRAVIAHERANPSLRQTNPVRAYQDAQLSERMKRMNRARAFASAGTNASDVSDELDVRAPIDRALGKRNKGRGRPSRPMAGSRIAQERQ